MNAGGEMPLFMISEPEYLQTRDDIGDVYLVKFSISNVGDSRGLVDFMDPEAVMALVGDAGVEPLAADVKGRLEKVMAEL